jgi:hypothetical protein
MALDPPLLDARTPLALVGETFCLVRDGVAGRFESAEAGKIRAEGLVVLTTARLCFIPRGAGAGARAFDVPLQGLLREAFQQPWFGANYLEGEVAPVPGRGIVNNISFRFTFLNGGAGTFLRVFFSLIEKYRCPPAAAPAAAAFLAPPAMQQWLHAQLALVDPSDPTTIYIEQPRQPPPHQQRRQFAPVPVGGSGGGADEPGEGESLLRQAPPPRPDTPAAALLPSLTYAEAAALAQAQQSAPPHEPQYRR